MPTDDRMASVRRAADDGYDAKVRVTKKVTMTVAGNTTVTAQITLPKGADFRSLTLDTPTAISGTPTHTYFRAGTAASGQEVVADVEAKSQGHVTCTIVAALNKGTMAASSNTVIYYELTTSGGSSSAGDVQVFCGYDAPVF